MSSDHKAYQKPKVLELADDLALNHTYCQEEILQEAATELRRLHDLLGKANALCRIRLNRIQTLEEWIEQQSEQTDTCTYFILNKKCNNCKCKRSKS